MEEEIKKTEYKKEEVDQKTKNKKTLVLFIW